MKIDRKAPILVTGSHRSGSTWVGKVLSTASDTAYIHEPFNPNNFSPFIEKGTFTNWFAYVSDHNEVKYIEPIRKLVEFHSSGLQFLLGNFNWDSFKFMLQSYYLCQVWRKNSYQLLLKDPIAIMSIEWLHRRFSFQTVAVHRHPAAFVSSVLLRKWDFDFNNLLNQSNLMADKLSSYSQDIHLANKCDDQIVRMSVLWNCLNGVLISESQNMPSAIFRVRHEDLSNDPYKYFLGIFEFLNLDMNENTKNYIKTTTDGEYSLGTTPIHDVTRESEKNISVWKDRLTKKQIEKIRTITEKVSHKIYSEEDW